MGITKLKRQHILGQFVLGTDMLAQGIADNVGLSPGYTRTNRPQGLILANRSARRFYNPNTQGGLVYSAPGLTVYRWNTFTSFSGNDFSAYVNGLTVDGIIDPSSPRGMNPMTFTLPDTRWDLLGVPLGANVRTVKIRAIANLFAPLPQFVGFDTGTGDTRGNILSFFCGVRTHTVSLDANLGSLGQPIPVGYYRTPYMLMTGEIDFSFVGAPAVFDIALEILWQYTDARFNLKRLEFVIEWI